MMTSHQHTLSLSIAGLGLALRCRDQGIIASLQRRYQDFPFNGQVHLNIDVNLMGQERPNALIDTGTRFKEGILHFTAPGYTGWIDENRGEGSLDLSSIQPVEDIDYLIRVAYALLAFQAGGLILHAAGIVRDSSAFLFFGHSGAGKTTVSRLSTDCTVLNDDLVLLLPLGSGWQVYGTPFWNPSQVQPVAHAAPLSDLFRLVQDKFVYLEPCSSSQALAELVANVPVIPDDLIRGKILLNRLLQIIQAIPVRKLHFLPDSSFWNII